MAIYRGAECRLCRREGVKLFLKSERCYKDKCAFERREYKPGQHGQNNTKNTDYATQLREKQKLRRYYGVMEKQFSKYFKKAARRKGITGNNLLEILERRIDNVVYRLGLASTRLQARQLVNHGHIKVNNRKVDIASFQVKINDVISIAENSKKMQIIPTSLKFSERITLPSWLEIDKEKLVGKVKALPAREDVTLPIQEKLVIELYSK